MFAGLLALEALGGSPPNVLARGQSETHKNLNLYNTSVDFFPSSLAVNNPCESQANPWRNSGGAEMPQEPSQATLDIKGCMLLRFPTLEIKYRLTRLSLSLGSLRPDLS